MKIVALSDTHRLHDEIVVPDGDIFIHAGDMTGLGNHWELLKVGQWIESLKDKFKHRIIIAGNHDLGFEINKKAILEECFDDDVIYLQDSEVVIDGIKFYGTPWMPIFYDWAFMRKEEMLAQYYANIPDDTDVLITHCPPYGILDKNSNGESCGSHALYFRIKQLQQLKHHIFGHIHHSNGEEKIDDVTFHNVCSLNDQYRYVNAPRVIQL